jgi:hypothetical protein
VKPMDTNLLAQAVLDEYSQKVLDMVLADVHVGGDARKPIVPSLRGLVLV